jgi:hypothetical protein
MHIHDFDTQQAPVERDRGNVDLSLDLHTLSRRLIRGIIREPKALLAHPAAVVRIIGYATGDVAGVRWFLRARYARCVAVFGTFPAKLAGRTRTGGAGYAGCAAGRHVVTCVGVCWMGGFSVYVVRSR